MPKSITSNKLNVTNYLTLGTCRENLPTGETNVEIFGG